MVELIEFLPLGFYLLLALTISFLCSLLEAILLSVSHGHIELLVKEGHKAGPRLKYLKEHTDRSLAAILTLNTVAHTLGAAGVGSQVSKLYGNNWVVAASVVMTLLILIFSEIIPKSIGAANWKRLAPMASHIIKWLIFLTLPLVWVLERISKLFQPHGYKAEVTREEMIAVAEMGEEQGSIEADETRIIRNLLRLDNIVAQDIMTPSTVMFTVHQDQTVEEVVKANTPLRFSRIPVIEEDLDHVVGVVLRSVLLDVLSQGQKDIKMKELLMPLLTVKPEEPVGSMLDKFIEQRDHLFLVVDEYGSTQGLVTLEDAIETLLGVEIVDESDSVDDMRELARQQWQERRRAKDILETQRLP